MLYPVELWGLGVLHNAIAVAVIEERGPTPLLPSLTYQNHGGCPHPVETTIVPV